MPLHEESRLDHLATLMFQGLYWHSLLPVHDLPWIGAAMPASGEHRTPSGGHRQDEE